MNDAGSEVEGRARYAEASAEAEQFSFDVTHTIKEAAVDPCVALPHEMRVSGAVDRTKRLAWFSRDDGAPTLVISDERGWLHSAEAWEEPAGWLLVTDPSADSALTWIGDTYLVWLADPRYFVFGEGFPFAPGSLSGDLRQGSIADAEHIGTENLDGKEADVYAVSQLLAEGQPESLVEMWIVDGVVRRHRNTSVYESEGQDRSEIDRDIWFDSYGEPVHASEPTADDLIDAEALDGTELPPSAAGCEATPIFL